MKWLIPIGLALAALQGPVWCHAQTAPTGVRDRARLFSDEAIKKADAALNALRRERGWQVAIETVDTLHGATVRDRAVANARALKVHGLYILIARDEHKVWGEPSDSARSVFTHDRVQAISDAITRAFRAKDFDRGLLDAVDLVQKDAGPTAAAHGGIHDNARLFSSDAIKKAEQEIEAIQRQTKRQVVVETVDSLHGRPIEREAVERARAHNVQGVYILVSKDPHRVYVEPSQSATKELRKAKVDAIASTLRDAFRAGKFDQGLLDAVTEVKRDLEAPSAATAESPRPRSETASAPLANAAEPPAVPPAPGDVRRGVAEAPRAPVEAPAPAAVPQVPVAAAQPSKLPALIAIIAAAVILMWLLSHALKRSAQAPVPGQQGPFSGTPTGQPGYPPAPPRAPTAYGPGQPVPPGGPYPGYGPGPGYPQGAYGAPPPPQRGGGGFMSGMLGGLGGAVVGNILYDQFGRPHHQEGHPVPGPESQHGGVIPPAGYPHDAGATPPPSETYDPNAGAGGDWGDDSAAPQAQPDQWNAGGGAGGDWGAPEPQGSADAPAENWDQGAGAGGDWGSEAVDDSGGTGGDWGADPGAGQDDGGAGGDWGQDASTDENNGGGGNW